jgi:hypothetical protein
MGNNSEMGTQPRLPLLHHYFIISQFKTLISFKAEGEFAAADKGRAFGFSPKKFVIDGNQRLFCRPKRQNSIWVTR